MFALAILVVLFLYPYVIYPMLLYIATRLLKLEQKAGGQANPSVAMVICALNEENIIAQKLDNCLALEYPGKLRIIVVSDGSTDRTADVVRKYVTSGIELIDRKQRRGKVANLNEVLPDLREDILVLSDANVMYRADAIIRLVARFGDPSVGCVSGKVILTDSTPRLDDATARYYSLEWFLQDKSSLLHSMAGADGAMYALRRDLFRPCPNDTIIEDFVIPMTIIRQRHRVVHEAAALGWEKGPATLREEFRRKVRIAAGAAQGLIRGNAWPPPDAPLRFWFTFLSHKLLRWVSPMVGLAIVACAFLTIHEPASRVVLAALSVLIGLGVLQIMTRWANPIVSAPFYFLFGQVALGYGLLKGLLGQQTVLWAKESR